MSDEEILTLVEEVFPPDPPPLPEPPSFSARHIRWLSELPPDLVVADVLRALQPPEYVIEWRWYHQAALEFIACHPGAQLSRVDAGWRRMNKHSELALWRLVERVGSGKYRVTERGREALAGLVTIPRTLTVQGHGRGRDPEVVGVSEVRVSVRCSGRSSG